MKRTDSGEIHEKDRIADTGEEGSNASGLRVFTKDASSVSAGPASAIPGRSPVPPLPKDDPKLNKLEPKMEKDQVRVNFNAPPVTLWFRDKAGKVKTIAGVEKKLNGPNIAPSADDHEWGHAVKAGPSKPKSRGGRKKRSPSDRKDVGGGWNTSTKVKKFGYKPADVIVPLLRSPPGGNPLNLREDIPMPTSRKRRKRKSVKGKSVVRDGTKSTSSSDPYSSGYSKDSPFTSGSSNPQSHSTPGTEKRGMLSHPEPSTHNTPIGVNSGDHGLDMEDAMKQFEKQQQQQLLLEQFAASQQGAKKSNAELRRSIELLNEANESTSKSNLRSGSAGRGSRGGSAGTKESTPSKPRYGNSNIGAATAAINNAVNALAKPPRAPRVLKKQYVTQRRRSNEKPFQPLKGVYMDSTPFPGILTKPFPLGQTKEILFGPYEDELEEIEKLLEKKLTCHPPEEYLFPLHVYGKHSPNRLAQIDDMLSTPSELPFSRLSLHEYSYASLPDITSQDSSRPISRESNATYPSSFFNVDSASNVKAESIAL